MLGQTGQQRQDSNDRTAREGHRDGTVRNRVFGTRLLGQDIITEDSENMTARVGQGTRELG
jgi:hypothetical protein